MTESDFEIDLIPHFSFHRRFEAVGRMGGISLPANSTVEIYLVLSDMTGWEDQSYLELRDVEHLRAAVNLVPYHKAWNPTHPHRYCSWWETVSSQARRPLNPKAREGRVEEFLEEVYSLAQLGLIDRATDRIFDFIDRLLCDGLFAVCDDVMKQVEIDRLPTILLRSFLAITDAAKNRLPSRRFLYKRILARILSEKGEEETKRLLTRLA